MKSFSIFNRVLLLVLMLLMVWALGGCTTQLEREQPQYAPVASVDPYPHLTPAVPNGAIYQASGHQMVLFEDIRARQVGDILTVVLSEATDAAKSSDTSLDKDSATTITDPVLAGKLRGLGGGSNFGFDLKSNSAFDGESASAQRNSLNGSIAVTVAKVLPGGNLYIQGEKWIQINQGNEYIRLRGIVRPVDIAPDNTIQSTLVADARISYGGTGPTADVNRVGWLSRFFLSPVWPF